MDCLALVKVEHMLITFIYNLNKNYYNRMKETLASNKLVKIISQ